jgi:hypothetical protein
LVRLAMSQAVLCPRQLGFDKGITKLSNWWVDLTGAVESSH